MKKVFIKIGRKGAFIIIILLATINSLLFHYMLSDEPLIIVLIDFVFYFQLFSIILGSLIAIIPFGKLLYGQRFINVSLINMFVIQGFLFVSHLLILLFRILGWMQVDEIKSIIV